MFKNIARAGLALFTLALLSCGGGVFSTGGLAPALPEAGAAPNIFKKYKANGDSFMASGWTRGMDMSGVSFNSKRTATLITPRHVVMAKHYQREKGVPVIFHNRSGKRLRRIIIRRENARGDVAVGLLNRAVPADYHPYVLPEPKTDYQELLGRHVIVSNQNRRLFFHLVGNVGQGHISFRQDPAKEYGWGKNLIVGDSGNPSFLIAGKELVLIETHTTGGPGAGPFFGDPDIQAGIRAAVQKLDPEYQIRTKKL